jgi:predicted dehydrogenase
MASTYDKLKAKAVDGGWPPVNSRKGDIYKNVFDVEDLVSTFIKFKNGSTLFLEASWAGYSETGIRISLFGDKGGVELEGAVGGIDEGQPINFKFHKEIDKHLVDISPIIPETYSYWDIPWPKLIQHFIDCIREDKEPIVKLKEILYGSKIIDAIYRSAKEEKMIKT